MAYCTNAHVASEFKDIVFSSGTVVTDTEVDRFIAEQDAVINGKVGLKYEVPLTGASSLLIARMICTALVAARISKIIAMKTGKPPKDQARINDEGDSAMKMLGEIVSGKLLLSDSDLAVSHDGVSSYNYNNDITHSFDVTTQQW